MIPDRYLLRHHPSVANLVSREIERTIDMTHKENRTPYQFALETKLEALRRARYRCEKCGKQDSSTDRLQIHHQVAIWFARENPCLAIEVIKSLENAIALCADCHRAEHLHESRHYYAEQTLVVVNKWLESHIDPHLDDWRDKLATVVVERT